MFRMPIRPRRLATPGIESDCRASSGGSTSRHRGASSSKK
jgi:hypothetical protein